VNWSSDSPWYTDRYILRNSTIESRQCILYTCLQEISARVDNGIYSETIQDTIHGTEITTPAGESAFVYSYTDRNDGSVTNTTITSSEQRSLFDVILVPFQDDYSTISRFDYVYSVYSNLSTDTDVWLRGSEMTKTLYLTPNITDMVHTLVHYMNVALRSINTFEDYRTSLLNDTELPKYYISPKDRVAGRVLIDVIHVRVRCVKG
jgi:hypothetical protein